MPSNEWWSEASKVARKLLFSTGRAAWIAGTTFLVLAVPLIIESDRDSQIQELENQQVNQFSDHLIFLLGRLSFQRFFGSHCCLNKNPQPLLIHCPTAT